MYITHKHTFTFKNTQMNSQAVSVYLSLLLDVFEERLGWVRARLGQCSK